MRRRSHFSTLCISLQDVPGLLLHLDREDSGNGVDIAFGIADYRSSSGLNGDDRCGRGLLLLGLLGGGNRFR